jgi:glucuronosyltransferase
MSQLFRDRPQTPLETAIFWIEHVIRHGGAPHLRSAAVDLSWYQYLLLDVLAVLILVFVTSCLIVYILFKKLLKFFLLKVIKKQSNKEPKLLKSQ